ncbi:hypothetical protein [Bifidobacterium pseudolongum]|uniref:hypothetical protein n=1 Tax=Bifidobacterium pseudolongum TaxID=1694 RepID=UPI00101F2312|nr:hypothetical protein [Bifidobacterium pseudolongum]RYQ68784.1 hypothetical protein PG2103B_1007 [Bifidobacterium pseudolongum subsp. globosum]
MKCAICGAEFAPNPNSKRKPKYCSPACKQRAYKLRKNIGAKPITKKTITPKQALADDFEYSGDIPMNRHAFNRRMEREMDEPLEATLRRSKNRLQKIIDDRDTPPNCIAQLTKTLIEVSEKLEAITGGADMLPDLLAADDAEESEEIDDGLGAQII